MSTGYKVVDEVTVGDDEQVMSEWQTIRATFRDFATLPSERGVRTDSPVLKCHGLEWQIIIYPGGHNTSRADNVFCSMFLHCKSCRTKIKVKAQYRIRVASATGCAVVAKGDKGWSTFANHSSAWGPKNFMLRCSVLDPSRNFLVNGDLTVEIDLRVMLDKPPTWTPKNTVCSDMLKLLDTADADNSDILFEILKTVGGSKDGEERNLHSFYAHRNILSVRCPTLASLAEDCPDGSPIPITEADPDIFRMLLRFVYAGEVPDQIDLAEKSKNIIRVADRFGCTGLKLVAEAQLASDGITTVNAAELILFADGTNCAMLKEAAMDYFVKNAQAVMASKGFEQVKESPAVMAELMAVGFGGSKKRSAPADANDDDRDYKRMRVATLRQKLDEKSLDVDGSKEMLVSRLEAADAEDQAAARDEAENGEDGSDEEDNDEDEDSDEESDENGV